MALSSTQDISQLLRYRDSEVLSFHYKLVYFMKRSRLKAFGLCCLVQKKQSTSYLVVIMEQ